MRFKDREDAGKQLAEALSRLALEDVQVFALPRGGVPVGYQIARAFRAQLGVIITRKIGHPYNQEYAICAVAEDGDTLCDESEIAKVDANWLRRRIILEEEEAKRRREVYMESKKPVEVEGKTAVLVDDGVATGLTFLLAIKELKHLKPRMIVAALPVAPEDIANQIRQLVDELVVLNIPFDFLGAVGMYYDEFYPVSDEEVVQLIEQSI